MKHEAIIVRLKALGYNVAQERTDPEQLKAWKMPYCAITVGTETTEGADLRPFLRKQPTTVTLFTRTLDRAEQGNVKALLNETAIAYTMEGEFIEDGQIYATDFHFTLINKI